jgi:uncharacterized repeat protein (TIGR02543 family)
MTNKICLWWIIAFVLGAAVIGCENDALIRKSAAVKILSVTPNLTDGVEQPLTVTAEFNVNLFVNQGIDLIVAFNTEELLDFKVYDHINVTGLGWDGVSIDSVGEGLLGDNQTGSGKYTFNVTVQPKDWSPHGKFQASVYLGFVNYDGSVSSAVLANDRKSISVHKDDNYWSITWYTNGGARGSVYPGRVAKGAVLAKPSPAPTKRDHAFVGWYTDAALAQEYHFADSVTADLNLYAKWESVSPLYGRWVNTKDARVTLTISANYIQYGHSNDVRSYRNPVWGEIAENTNVTYKTDYPKGYPLTADGNVGRTLFIALSTDGQSVYLGENAAEEINYINGYFPPTCTKQQ